MKESGYIGIISAMDIEVAALLSRAEIERVDTIGGVKYHVGTLGGKKVVITRSGLGKVYAASGAAVMLTSYPVSSVLFTGLGGGVGKQTRVLDVVVATELVQHDYGFRHNDRFEWAPDLNGIDTGTLGYSFCDPRMVEAAYRAAAEVIGAEHVFRGLVATGDQFVMSEDQVDWLSEYFGAMACEMEGASVAAVCERYGVPFVVIRCMSDRADGLAHESIDNMGERAAAQSARIVMKMLESARGEAEEETAEAPAVSWTDKLFDDTRVHAVAIRPAEGAAAGAEYRAEVEIDGEVFRDVSVTEEESAPQASGTAGAGDGPCGFRIDFGKYREGQTYHGLDRLRLDSLSADPSGMKEALRLRLFSAAGVQAPLSAYAELNVGGESRGLYLAVEGAGEGFLRRAFGGKGVLYRPDARGADFRYRGENRERYAEITGRAQTPAALRDDRRVFAALRAVSTGTDIETYYDMDEIIHFFAAYRFLSDGACAGEALRGVLLYENEGRLGVYPAAVDGTAFGGTGTPADGSAEEEKKTPLWKLIRENGAYPEKYRAALKTFLDSSILSGAAEREIERLRGLIRPYLAADPAGSEKACEALKTFLTRRAGDMDGEL